MGGFICLLYICIVQDLERNLIWFAQLTRGGSSAFGIYIFSMHWYFLIFSYKLTVLNGLSLATLKSIEFT